jgi:hypothetical protein
VWCSSEHFTTWRTSLYEISPTRKQLLISGFCVLIKTSVKPVRVTCRKGDFHVICPLGLKKGRFVCSSFPAIYFEGQVCARMNIGSHTQNMSSRCNRCWERSFSISTGKPVVDRSICTVTCISDYRRGSDG